MKTFGIFAIAFVAAGIWGFVTALLGAPTIVISGGAVLIGAIIASRAFKAEE